MTMIRKIYTGEDIGTLEDIIAGNITNLRGADLEGTDLRGANLTGVYLRGANLTGVYLRGANLTGVYLRGADLEGADLTGADLTGADLEGADLTGADLTGADLEGADLEGADLSFTKGIISFYLGEHFGFVAINTKNPEESYTRVGWEGYPLGYWVRNYKTIGYYNNYSDKASELYGGVLKTILTSLKEDKRYEILNYNRQRRQVHCGRNRVH